MALKKGLRFDEILQTINSRDSLIEEFDEETFNALVEKIEFLTLTHFVFELKSEQSFYGLRVHRLTIYKIAKHKSIIRLRNVFYECCHAVR